MDRLQWIRDFRYIIPCGLREAVAIHAQYGHLSPLEASESISGRSIPQTCGDCRVVAGMVVLCPLHAAAPDGLDVVRLWLACYRLREQVWASPEGRREARELLDAHGVENWPDMLAIVSRMSKEFIAKAEGR